MFFSGFLIIRKSRYIADEVTITYNRRKSVWIPMVRFLTEVRCIRKSWMIYVSSSFKISSYGGDSMLTILFFIFLIWFFLKLLFFGIRAAWSIFKILVIVIFLPFILIGMVVAGLLYIAFPVLIILGILSLFIPGNGN